PLPVPDPSGLTALDRLRRYPAPSLFIERARTVNPELEPTRAVMTAVVKICRRLDGLPLAIELAAAHMDTMSAEALLTSLDHRLEILRSDAPDLPPRQRAMRDTIAWSFHLLDVPDRLYFRRACVFAGQFTLEAAHEVCAEPDTALTETLDRLDAL